MVANFNKKQKGEEPSNQLLFQAIGIVILLIAVILVVADIKIYKKSGELNSEISAYQKHMEDIKKSNQTLKDEIANSDNADYYEKIAREQQNMQKPGEKVVSFVSAGDQKTSENKNENFWDKLWSWLKNKF